MTPFYFGKPERRLFGVYDPPRLSRAGGSAVVICPPSGDEQVHAYRTLRQLAAKLAMAGTHVLRFDFYGSGDSYGETGDGDSASWCEDIDTAITELKDMSGAARMSLVGLRSGANLAAAAAVQHPDQIADLVLWDPLDTGDASSPNEHIPAVDPAAFPARLLSRTRVLLTASEGRRDRDARFAVAECSGVRPWDEERIETGTIPLNALQQIVKWLAR